MNYILKNLTCPITATPNFLTLINQKFGFTLSQADHYTIAKRNIDARHPNHLKFVYTVELQTTQTIKPHPDIISPTPEPPPTEKIPHPPCQTPFIIGMGPAGLLTALTFIEMGIKPYIFEQGDPIDIRKQKVEAFWNTKVLDSHSNVQFGEGGAGTFSDGKLTTRTHNIYTEKAFQALIKFGADPDIAVNALPHIGTDKLRQIIVNIRKYLLQQGCQIFYNSKLTDITIKDHKVTQITINGVTHSPEVLILATGNSAREVYTLCTKRGIALQDKPFAVGLRIEHPLEYINHTFYGERNDFTLTGPATYKLTHNHNNRGIYSFCMCPGGFVIPASSEAGCQVVNGMSYHKRDNPFSNSAIVVGVTEQDYGQGLLDGMRYQIALEKAFFHGWSAPAQIATNFCKNTFSSKLQSNSYCHDLVPKNLHDLLPTYISQGITTAMQAFNSRYPHFIDKGLFIGVETRTSAPVFITRDKQNLCSISADNLYAVGEGAGYAGGIMSSMADGIKIASIFEK